MDALGLVLIVSTAAEACVPEAFLVSRSFETKALRRDQV